MHLSKMTSLHSLHMIPGEGWCSADELVTLKELVSEVMPFLTTFNLLNL